MSLRCRKIVSGGGERRPLPKATARPRSRAAYHEPGSGEIVGPAVRERLAGEAHDVERVARHGLGVVRVRVADLEDRLAQRGIVAREHGAAGPR